VGLDFYGDKSLLKKELQMHVFEEQLDLATQHPVVLHVVQAHGAALNILKDFSLKGFVHNFTGSIEVAEQYLDQGILLSFGTSLLKEHFKNAQESFRKLPLEAILLESDSPSDPLDTSDPVEIYNQVIHRAAEIKALSEEEVREQISKNILSLQNS
jgi:TatD DNase family protein